MSHKLDLHGVLRGWWDENKGLLSHEFEFYYNRASQSAIRCKHCFVNWLRVDTEAEAIEYATELNGAIFWLKPADPDLFSKLQKILKSVEGKHDNRYGNSYTDIE